jgi:hypothetical protein
VQGSTKNGCALASAAGVAVDSTAGVDASTLSVDALRPHAINVVERKTTRLHPVTATTWRT